LHRFKRRLRTGFMGEGLYGIRDDRLGAAGPFAPGSLADSFERRDPAGGGCRVWAALGAIGARLGHHQAHREVFDFAAQCFQA